MNLNKLVNEVLSELSLYEETAAELEKEMHRCAHNQDIRKIQQIRVSQRFLRRWKQLQNGIIQNYDFLGSLRDQVLFNGRLQAPSELIQMVANAGQPFGLFVDTDHYVNATISMPDWLSESEKFVKTVYGKLYVELKEPKVAIGDAYLCGLTPFKYYRSYEQKIAVHTALTLPAGFTMLLSLPTGGGKSLITQILTAVHDKLTLVIVPTVALALDQVRAAKEILKKSIPLEYIASYQGGQNHQITSKIVKHIKSGKMRLLVISPEAVLKNELLYDALLQAASNKTIGSIVMDEAHMIPDWGAQFRPEFQLLSIFRRKLMEISDGEIRTFLLSATLPNENVKALKELYCSNEKWVELRSDALRSEPRFSYLRCRSNEKKENMIIELSRLMPKPLIIYVLSPSDANYWISILRRQGFKNVTCFTGDTGGEERSETIEAWNNDEVDIVVATSAFGMGVDKPDVRTVIHACLPENLNRFYQEVGRGGRDGWPSLSILCVNPKGDEGVSSQLINGDSRAASSLVPRVMMTENIVSRWFSMKNAESSRHEGDIVILDTSEPPIYFTVQQRELSGNQNMRWNLNVLLFLHRYKYIELQEVNYNKLRDCYHVKVHISDIDLMTNHEMLISKMQIDRENELEAARDGFNRMKNLIKEPERICWGERFVNLYPYAYVTCAGCPSHNNQELTARGYTLGKEIPIYDLSCEPLPSLNELMGSFSDMLIPRSETSLFDKDDAQKLALKLNQCGIKVWVIPDNCIIATDSFKGLVLTEREFIYTSIHHPSILSGAIFVAFGDDYEINQQVFNKAAAINKKKGRVVYFAKESMFIQEEVRTIANVVRGYVRNTDYVLEG